ncbi:MAG: YafY family transcriptional regulator [Hyphomicrobium sp.]|uniref:helix-turn-helix transcriptional regulator n=1 Tax=Hyphomicrobium sp. TaxID=82 RepID=UPI0013269444|nr:YafY family protein [Hyphomicrobium sp.]KAB2941036.1 MAG: YafY family transcriptional regulator [Hyphomicrobium sp.]MBZ0210924.1 YafY family transcriptional regulator [Hyphomicrobium sp.]
MRRADRLLQLLQILRRHRRPVTASVIADELEVCVRTVYRDIAGLAGEGVPIRGEAGIGYVLGEGYDLPPLMFNADEIEAMLVGLRWVEARADASLSRAARDVVAKIGDILPKHLKPVLFEPAVDAPRFSPPPPEESIDVAALRAAIRERRKVAISYHDEQGRASRRVIWPLALGYFEMSRIVVAWCELRGDFRHFRTDRMRKAEIFHQRYPGTRAKLLARWRGTIDEGRAA